MLGPERNAKDPKEPLTFEQLSSVVTQLEDGEQPLATFERVALSRLGSKRLDEAERRLDGSESKIGIETRPFDAEQDDE